MVDLELVPGLAARRALAARRQLVEEIGEGAIFRLVIVGLGDPGLVVLRLDLEITLLPLETLLAKRLVAFTWTLAFGAFR